MKYLITFALLSWAIFSYANEYEELILTCSGQGELIIGDPNPSIKDTITSISSADRNYYFLIDKNWRSSNKQNAASRGTVKSNYSAIEYDCIITKDAYSCASDYSKRTKSKDSKYSLRINRVTGKWWEFEMYDELTIKETKGECRKGEIRF